MATNIIHLQNLRSKDVLSDSSANLDVAKHFDGVTSPKLPTEEQLEYGDIALNIASNYETLAIKNIDGKIVYLPFNLTERLYTQELSLSAVKADFSNDIEKINGIVVSDHDIISVNNERIYQLNEAMSALTVTYDKVIAAAQNDLSGQVNSLTVSLEGLHNKEAEDFSALTVSISTLGGAINNLNTLYNNNIQPQINSLLNIVSAQTEVYNRLILENEETQLVHAAAFVKLKRVVGLSDNGEYEPVTDFLSGSSISDAIDITNSRISQLDFRQQVNFEKTKSEIENQIEALSSAVDEKLSINSGISVSACDAKINNAVNTANSYTKNTANQLRQEIKAYSARTATELNKFNLKINENAANLSADTVDRINSLAINLTDSLKKSEEELSDKLNDKVQLVSEALSGLVKDEETELKTDFRGLQVAVNNNIQEVAKEAIGGINTLSGKIETVYTTLSGQISVNQSFNAVAHESFDERIKVLERESDEENVRINVNSGNVQSLESELREDEYVRAFAISKFKNSIGLNTNGEYEPYTEILSGRTMTEAIDTIYDKTVSMESSIKRDINSTLNNIKSDIKASQSALTSSIKELSNTDSENYSALKKYAETSVEKAKTDIKSLITTKENALSTKITTLSNTVRTNAATAYQRDTTLGTRIDNQGVILRNAIQSAQNLAITSAATMVENAQSAIDSTIKANEKANTSTHKIFAKQIDELSGKSESLKEDIANQINALSSKTGFFSGILEPVQESVAELSSRTELLSTQTDALSAETININRDLAQDEYVKAKAFVRFNASLGFNENAEYHPASINLSGRTVTEALDYFGDYVNILERDFNNLKESIDEFNVQHVKTVTYEKLMGLLLMGRLQWGQWYRISNYQTTINSNYSDVTTRLKVKDSDSNTNSGFYILVRATSFNTLSEDAIAMPCEYDTYFDYSNVEGWQLKYCLFNDISRFAWAKNNGFGVIYYMQDEFGNEANYDFKNIKFNGKFTFNNVNTNTDLSLTGKAYGNIINPYLDDNHRFEFNKIVISSNSIIGNTFQAGCYDIEITNTSFNGNQIAASYNNKSITKTMNYKLIGYSLV